MPINPEIWEFPCRHDIKVFGLSHHPLTDVVSAVVKAQALSFDPASIRSKSSSGGKYLCVTIGVEFQTKEQVDALYQALHACPEVTQTL